MADFFNTSPTQIDNTSDFYNTAGQSQQDFFNTPSSSQQGATLANPTQVTQDFGTYNPIEPTADHRAADTNFSANMGDNVSAPKGNWQAVC